MSPISYLCFVLGVLTPCLNRFICGVQPDSITTFVSTLFPPFTQILQGDIDRAYPLRLFFHTKSDKTKCYRIHTIRFPDSRANAYIAQGRTGRLPHPPSLPPHASDLVTEGLRPWTRLAVAGFPFTRCCGDGRRRPTYSSARNCTAEARAEQSKRWLGLRTLAECRASCSFVSGPYLWRFAVVD